MLLHDDQERMCLNPPIQTEPEPHAVSNRPALDHGGRLYLTLDDARWTARISPSSEHSDRTEPYSDRRQSLLVIWESKGDKGVAGLGSELSCAAGSDHQILPTINHIG